MVNIESQDFDEIFIQHPNWGTSEKVNGHDDNYMTQKVIDVPGNDQHLRDTMTLVSAHIDVAVEIFGLERPAGTRAYEIPYELSFENSNAQTSFNNEINEAEKVSAIPIWYTMKNGNVIAQTILPSSAWIMTASCRTNFASTYWC